MMVYVDSTVMQALRVELEQCHRYLDDAGVPRVFGDRTLSLRDRIAVLVELDADEILGAGARSTPTPNG